MEEREAAELVSGLDLPREAGQLLVDPAFWCEAVFLEVCHQCDELIFTAPREGFELSKIMPEYAVKIPPDRCSEKRTPRHLLGRGVVMKASGLRAVGAYHEAEMLYRAAALALAGAPDEDKARYWFKVTLLRLGKRDYENALASAESGLRLSRRVDAHEQGKALMWRGSVHWHSNHPEKAMRDFLASLDRLKPERSKRYHFCALGNLAVAVEAAADESDTAAIRQALGHLAQARELAYFKAASLPGVKLVWGEARCLEKLGLVDDAESGFREARSGMAELEVPFEYALVSLDLAAVIFRRGGFSEVRELAAEMFPIFRSLKLSRDSEAYSALILFHLAAVAEGLTLALIEDARSKLRKHDLAQG